MLDALALATVLTGTALVEEADRRNLVYTRCLFEQVRQAREESLPEAAMLARLETVCRAQRLALEEAAVSVRMERGESAAEAQASWHQVHANSIEAVRRAYALRLSEPQR